MTSVGWLPDETEESLRSALAVAVPDLAALPARFAPRHAASDPLWWSSSAVVGDRAVVKFAWSEVRARRLWREGVLLGRLATGEPPLPVPELIALHAEPALVVTRLVRGVPLAFGWARTFDHSGRTDVANHLAGFLVGLHGRDVANAVGDLDPLDPTPQADTQGLRARFPRLVDEDRSASVVRWCEWVDHVLDGRDSKNTGVLLHGDLHGYNQLWDRSSRTLLAVVDFEQSCVGDPEFDLRYLPGYSRGLELRTPSSMPTSGARGGGWRSSG